MPSIHQKARQPKTQGKLVKASRGAFDAAQAELIRAKDARGIGTIGLPADGGFFSPVYVLGKAPLLKVAKDPASGWYYLGQVHHDLEQWQPARDAYERCLAIDAYHGRAHEQLAKIPTGQK